MTELSPWALRCMRICAGRAEIEMLDREKFARRFSRPMLGHFVDLASRIYATPAPVILGKCRKKRYVLARGWAMYHAYTEGRGLTLPDLARRFSGRDHTSAQHLIRRHAIRHGLHNPCPTGSPKVLVRLGRYEGPEPTLDAPYDPAAPLGRVAA